MKKVLYFGYGANRAPEMMSWITGRGDFEGKPAILEGWNLCIQRLDQIPKVAVPTSTGPRPLQEHLREKWGNDFETYVIRPGRGKVTGTLWTIELKDRELIRNWERVGFWYKEIKVKVKTENGEDIEVITECLGDNQSVDREVDGSNYDPFLLSRDTFRIKAKGARLGYFKRKGLIK
jgi:hypothetical protein